MLIIYPTVTGNRTYRVEKTGVTNVKFWRRQVRYVVPLLFWMGFIFYMSGGIGSAHNTNPVLHSIFNRLFPKIAVKLSSDLVARIDFNIRKSAHVTEYTVLAILAFRAISQGDIQFRHSQIIFPLIIAIGYAATDEWHQSFVPTRGAAAADVVFDAMGGLIGIVVCLWHRLRHGDLHSCTSPPRPERLHGD